MNKQIYAFLIPLVILLAIGFTPLADDLLEEYRDEINLLQYKAVKYLRDSNGTVRKLNTVFENSIDAYSRYFKEEIGTDENTTIRLLNYMYYVNQRSIAMVKNHEMSLGYDKYDKERFFSEILKYETLKKQEYSCIKRTFGRIEQNLIDIYKEKVEVNRLMANVTYNYMLDFMEDHEEYTFDVNETSACRITKIYKEK